MMTVVIVAVVPAAVGFQQTKEMVLERPGKYSKMKEAAYFAAAVASRGETADTEHSVAHFLALHLSAAAAAVVAAASTAETPVAASKPKTAGIQRSGLSGCEGFERLERRAGASCSYSNNGVERQ